MRQRLGEGSIPASLLTSDHTSIFSTEGVDIPATSKIVVSLSWLGQEGNPLKYNLV